MLDRPQAVVFDWDNTLIDSWTTIHDALNLTLAAMRHPSWTLEETKARARLSLSDSFPKLFGSSWDEARKIYLESFEAIHLARLAPLTDAATCLDRLSAAGFYLAVVSNKTGRLLRREVEALGWNRYFARVVGAGDAVADKPDRATIDMALLDSGIEAGPHVWYVGDNELDVQTAHNANCTAVLIHSLATEHGDMKPPPDVVFGQFQDMIAVLENSWS